LFCSPKQAPPFSTMNQFPIETHRLNGDNFKKALLSSGSIPIVMHGVHDIVGIEGTFRDGGILDYHLDIPFLPPDSDGLVLYPHFYDHIIPGWFDKHLHRKPNPKHMDNVIVISPSQEFVASLPYRKIPDRTDFKTFQHDNRQRVSYWNKTVAMSKQLGDEFIDSIASGDIAKAVKPLEV